MSHASPTIGQPSRAGVFPGFLKIATLFVVVAATLLWMAWEPLTSGQKPISDIAADMLLANRIRDTGILLHGHYSRWSFNHPGPFWLYYSHLVEVMLGWTGLSPIQCWMISGLLANTLLICFCAAACSRYFLNATLATLSYALLFSLLIIGWIGYDITSIWMPDRLIVPYLTFLICLLFIARGEFRYLPVATFLAMMLVHGYVTMPIFTAPFLFIAWLAGRHTNRKNRSNPQNTVRWLLPDERLHLWLSFGIILIFAFPILVDWAISEHPNPLKILHVHAMQKSMPPSDWNELFGAWKEILWEGKSVGYLFLLIILPIALCAKKWKTPKHPAIAVFLMGIALVLTSVLYYKQTPAPLQSFVAKFVLAAPLLCLAWILSLAFVPDDSYAVARYPTTWLSKITLLAMTMLVALLSFPLKPIETPFLSSDIATFSDALATTKPQEILAIDYADHDDWPLMAGLLLDLDQRGIPACTTWQHMSFLYTPRYTCPPNIRPAVRLIQATDCDRDCLAVHADHAIRKTGH